MGDVLRVHARLLLAQGDRLTPVLIECRISVDREGFKGLMRKSGKDRVLLSDLLLHVAASAIQKSDEAKNPDKECVFDGTADLSITLTVRE